MDDLLPVGTFDNAILNFGKDVPLQVSKNWGV